MIENFDTEDFERALKEHADRFFLIPSERVWKSIYNDIHPGSRWPSLAVGLFMVLTLFWIGNVNNEYPAFNHQPAINQQVDQKKDLGHNNTELQISQLSAEVSKLKVSGEELAAQRPHTINQNTAINLLTTTYSTASVDRKPEKDFMNEWHVSGPVEAANATTVVSRLIPESLSSVRNTPAKNQQVVKSESSAKSSQIKRTTSGVDQVLSISSIMRKKLKWEFTFMPIISDVQFGGTNLNKINSTVINTPVSKHDMNIAKRLGFITGANVYYPLSRRVSLTSGVHVIYTGYNIFSEIVQPNTTSLTFKDSNGKMFSKYYVSYYANDKRNHNTSITNYNLQLSVPVGAQVDILSRSKFKISLVSSVEPYMVLGNKAYLLSGDASSYVTDPDLVRRFNLSGNIGGMVHFSSNTTNWRIGPNFRYQVLSTYTDIYPVREHFINYGIQVGVSRK